MSGIFSSAIFPPGIFAFETGSDASTASFSSPSCGFSEMFSSDAAFTFDAFFSSNACFNAGSNGSNDASPVVFTSFEVGGGSDDTSPSVFTSFEVAGGADAGSA